MDAHTEKTTEPESSLQWIVSGLFWGQLLLASMLYGGVALSPKLATLVELRTEWRQVDAQVARLGQQVDELERVVTALDRDPKLLQELARIDLDAARPDEERIKLDQGLTLQSRLADVPRHAPDVGRAWYNPVLDSFATNQRLRRACLALAMMLVLTSFTFFHPSQALRISSGWKNVRKGVAACSRRYRSAA